MQINLNYYEIIEAIENYIKEKHGIKASLDDLPDYPYLDTTKVIYQTSKDNDGNTTIDSDLTTYEKVNIEIAESAEIQIYI